MFERLPAKISSVLVRAVFKLPGTIRVEDGFYEGTADFYSSIFSSNKDDDIDMYRKFARVAGSPVLDAACGDGRIMLPLMRDGNTVFGFDSSASLIEYCGEKIAEEYPGETPVSCICRASLIHLPFKKHFRLAIIPYNSFNHLLSEKDQRLCLEGIRSILKNDGMLIMEVLPYHHYYETSLRLRKRGELLKNKSRITAYSRITQNLPGKSHTVYWYIFIKNPEGRVKRITSYFTRLDIPLKQLRQLVTSSGFAIQEIKYSYSDEKDLNKRIVIARKV